MIKNEIKKLRQINIKSSLCSDACEIKGLIFQVLFFIVLQLIVSFLFHIASFFVTVDRPLFNVSYFVMPFLIFFQEKLHIQDQ